MRSVFGKMLTALLLVSALLSLAVFAESETYTPGSDGTYSVGYSDGTSGAYYALLVVEGIVDEGSTPTISEDSVLYIDQATADSDGNVTFNGWIPKNDNPATVYLGGTNLDKPVLLGYLGENTFVISGTVSTDSGTTSLASITLKNDDGEYSATADSTGKYSVEVPEGTYKFTVTVKNHLSYTKSAFDVNEAKENVNVTLKGGDVNGDGNINIVDFTRVVSAYGTDSEIDINNDGTVNILDFTRIVSNYGTSAVSE